MKRYVRMGWVILGPLAILLTACGEVPRQSDGGATDASLAATGGSVAVGVASAPTTVLPPLATSALDGELGAVLFLGLNWPEWGDGELTYSQGHPLGLARSWQVDGATLTYRLDAGRTWSDGVPIRAADVAFTYALLKRLEHMPMAIAAARVDSVVVVDDSTVVFHFDAPYPGMFYDTGVGILPAHAYERLSEDELAAVGRSPETAPVVVSGPFTVSAWGADQRIELVANSRSPVQPRVDRISILAFPDPATRLAALRAGELDLALVESYRDAAALDSAAGTRLLRVPQRGYDYIAWNPSGHPAFASRDVRRALSLAIDRDAVLAALDMTSFAEKAYGPYGSLFEELAPPPPVGGDYDPVTAGALLSAAGWEDEDGDGVREKNGQDLAFELGVPADNDRRIGAAQLIQAQLAAVGVRVDLGSQEFNSLFARARARDYEAVFLGWQVGLDPDISFFWADPESPVNIASYDGPVARSHIQAALASTTAREAVPHWAEAARLIAMDYPYAFLWYFDFVWVASKRLEAVEVDAVGFLRNPHEWRVRDGT